MIPLNWHLTDKLFYGCLILMVMIVMLVTFVPLAGMGSGILAAPGSDYWNTFVTSELWPLLSQTFQLMFWVLITTTLMGFGVAFVTTYVEFPGRPVAIFLALVPFTIPPYVMSFIWLDLFRKLEQHVGIFEPMTGFLGLVWSMSLSLFPYVFVAARLGMQRLDKELLEAAGSLGHSTPTISRKILLPLLMPALLTSSFLVISEVLSDFGSVSIFAYDTLTTGIFKAWFGFFAPHDALKIAGVLLSVSLTFFILSHLLQKDALRWQSIPSKSPMTLIHLRSPYQWVTSLGLLLILSMGSVVPTGSLVALATQSSLSPSTTHSLIHIIWQSTFIAGLTAITVSVFAVATLFLQRLITTAKETSTPLTKKAMAFLTVLTRLPVLGHAIPGAVLAISLYVPLIYLGSTISVPLTAMLISLIMALSLHFFGVSAQTLSSPFQGLPREIDESALNLKSTQARLLTRIHLPLLARPMIMGALLVFMDVIKELPLTLMLRPLGWNTLSVKVYEWTAEGEWQKAALPSLGIMIICSVSAIILLSRQKIHRLHHRPPDKTSSSPLALFNPRCESSYVVS